MTTIGTPRSARAEPAPARLCAFNAGIQLVWGAILAVSLQARTLDLAPLGGIATYSQLAAGGAAVATVVQLVAGVLSDRARARGRAAFYVAGTLVAMVAIALFYGATSFAQLAGAFVLLQIGMNVAGGPYQAVIPDSVRPERRGTASSWMSAYQSFGNAVGVVTAGLVHDLRTVAGVLCAALATSCAVTVASVRGAEAQATLARATLRIRGPLGVLLLSRGAINVGFYTLLDYLEFFVRDSLGIAGAATREQTGYLFLTFTLAAVAGAVVAARPTDRLDKRVVVTAACIAIGIALAALAASGSLAPAYAAATAAGIAWGAFVTADWALATALLPPGAMATAMGVWNVATTIPQVFAPAIAAPLIVRFAATAPGLGPRAALVVAIVEFAAGAALVWRLPRA